MLDFEDAQKLLASNGPLPTQTEHLPIFCCTDRVLAEPLTAVLSLPSSHNSAMDGYAIRYADFQPGNALILQGRTYAGERRTSLEPGRAMRLFTGSLIPDGADTVVMQEHAREVDGAVTIDVPPRVGQHIRRQGEDIREGQVLLPQGSVLQPAQVGIIANQGIATVKVFSRVKVGILTTGDELVAVGSDRQSHQIYNSNAPMLAAWVEKLGAAVTCVLHSRDDAIAIRTALTQLLSQCDLIISAGGVSVGEKDLVKPAVESLGGTQVLSKVRMKPGKPLSVANMGRIPIVLLPGNPGAAFIVSTLLVSPMIRRMQGRAEVLPPVLAFPLRIQHSNRVERDEFIRVQCEMPSGRGAQLIPLRQQGPGALGSLSQTSGLARLPAGCQFRDGDSASYYDLQHWLM